MTPLNLLRRPVAAIAMLCCMAGATHAHNELASPDSSAVAQTAQCQACRLPGRIDAGSTQAAIPGVVSLPAPTRHHLSIEWPVEGDANHNGTVHVRFRALGAPTWRQGMPLRRIPAGSNPSVGRSWGNRHSGSLFGLTPDTDYEIELTLVDPDGGGTQRLVQAKTLAIPQPASDGVLRIATPATLASVLGQAQAGDIVELAAGTYAGFQLNRDGTADRPLTLRGTPGAVIEGELGLFFRAHWILQSLTVHGRIRFNGSNDIAILDCTVHARSNVGNGDGIVSFLRAERAYIAGNTVIGTTLWTESAFGANGANLGEGIVVTGPGHSIIGNTVRGFRDGISFLEGDAAVDQYSIDVLDNDISEAADDGIEADFCMHNCRIIGNRLTNTFIAFSSQPSLGGPTWFIRNQAYNVVHVPFKLYRGSVGDVVLHNTVIKHGDALNAYPGVTIHRALFRNNLFLGGPAGTFAGYASGSGRVIDLSMLNTANSSLDYNGYGTTLAEFRGRIGNTSFESFEQMLASTSEVHAQRVDLSVFADALALPDPPTVQYAPVSMHLAIDAVARDRGEPIPNINDDHQGCAPDLGAIETPAASCDILFQNGFEAAADQ